MPSPFPGMDPYMEDPAGWPNLHVNLITEIQAALNRQLRPKYYARAEDRVYVSDQDDPGRRVIAPDVRVLAREEQPPGPWVPIPLRTGDADAKLDLQQALNSVYDRSSYDLTIDYGSEPVPPLPREYARWTDRLLREKGLR